MLRKSNSIDFLVPDLRGGGAERVVINLANAFVNRGYACRVVLMTKRGELLTELDGRISVVDLRVKRVRQLLLPLVRYFRMVRPSTVVTCMWPLSAFTIFAKIISRTEARIVVAEHTTWSRSELLQRPTVGWQVRTSMHYLFPLADGIVCVSKGAADDLSGFARLNRRLISIIYNPVVGPERCRTVGVLNPAGWWVGGHKRILAVGTLKAVKGYATLLNGFARLHKIFDARLLILGEGECRAALEEQVCALGLQKHVFMPGFVQDPSPYYRRADLHVLSSLAEGFGNVIAEALANGTPVVSTDCPSGPREILADGEFGRLVPVGDVEALSLAMYESLVTPPDIAALKARAQDFSIEKSVDEYESLLFAHKDPLGTCDE